MIQQTTFLLRFIFHPQQDQAIKETVPVPLVPLEQKLLARGGARMVYRLEPDLEPLLDGEECSMSSRNLSPEDCIPVMAMQPRFGIGTRQHLPLQPFGE